MLNRRSLITGLVSLVAAPAIVRVGSLMPVKVMVEPEFRFFVVGQSIWGPGSLGVHVHWSEERGGMIPIEFMGEMFRDVG